MVYPFLTLDDNTEIVHSDVRPDGTVKVYMERPDAQLGFRHLHSAQLHLGGHCRLCPGGNRPLSGSDRIHRPSDSGILPNYSRIPEHTLRNIMKIIEARSEEIIQKWKSFFGEARFYC